MQCRQNTNMVDVSFHTINISPSPCIEIISECVCSITHGVLLVRTSLTFFSWLYFCSSNPERAFGHISAKGELVSQFDSEAHISNICVYLFGVWLK